MRQSLRWRLPLVIAALIGVTLAAFLWLAHRAVENTLVGAGAERARAAAAQVAGMLDASRALGELRRVASHEALQRFLRTRSPADREAAHARLAALGLGGPRRIELWDTTGTRLLEVAVPDTGSGDTPPKVLPPTTAPAAAGLSRLQRAGDVVFSDSVADVRDAAAGGERDAQPLLGYFLVRSTFSVSPPGIIGRLVGHDAIVIVGNVADGIWTDFETARHPPAIDLQREGIAQYRSADGQERVGALAGIRGTPWAAWVEFPRPELVAPAQGFLRSAILLALGVMLAATLLVWVVAAHITTPISELSDAAEAIAAGDYAQRVANGRHDEIGRLGHAFNVMAAEVEASHRRLESRVAERTAELAAARLEAERANQAKSTFISRMSHDLRTPLNAILGFAQVLELDQPGADRAEPVRQILSGGRYLLELINEVLDISRIEAGQLSLSPEPVLVRDVVQRAVELVKPLASPRGITLSIAPFGPDDAVRADRQRLSQVLLNLLSNAFKYNSAGGRVTVHTARVGHKRYRIAVTDTGAGIPESKLDLLFRPFERLGVEDLAIEGTGLGLALSRSLAEAMGGTIGVESVVDQGSTFWIELDEVSHHAAARPPAAAFAAEGPLRPARQGTILYVEDNLPNVRLMERILHQRPGVTLRHAPNATAGLAAVQESRPNAVLLDLHLPDISGEDLLHQLWEDPRNRTIPIVVVTADATPGLSRRLKAAGATAVLTKPLNIREVLQLLDALLNDPTETVARK